MIRKPEKREKADSVIDMAVKPITSVGDTVPSRARKDWFSSRDSSMISRKMKNLSGFAWNPTSQ